MSLRKIMTSHKPKPHGFEQWDWAASFADSSPETGVVGFGSTERQAIDDLIEKSGASQPFQLVKPGATS